MRIAGVKTCPNISVVIVQMSRNQALQRLEVALVKNALVPEQPRERAIRVL